MSANSVRTGSPRSQGSITQRRVPQPWPKARRFRILSLDGGGIRGVYPATILAELERKFTSPRKIGEFFDLIAGTSTGGIIALGLGKGMSAVDLQDLYQVRGNEIFPEPQRSLKGRVKSAFRWSRHWFLYHYDREAIAKILAEKLGDRLYGESLHRLCIPAFDGGNSEVFVFKTPHHPDYKIDRFEKMTTVALATSAAPTYFKPLQHGGYSLVDGGVWANNPIMLAVIEALVCFDISPDQIDVLSLGCGEDPYLVSGAQRRFGGKLFWSDAIFAAMRLQSMAATNQARLLLGPPSVVRILPQNHVPPIELDDWRRAVDNLPSDAVSAVDKMGDVIREKFLTSPAEPYVPIPPAARSD